MTKSANLSKFLSNLPATVQLASVQTLACVLEFVYVHFSLNIDISNPLVSNIVKNCSCLPSQHSSISAWIFPDSEPEILLQRTTNIQLSRFFRRHKADRFESYVQRLGYRNYRDLAKEAIRRLGPNASTNSLLECVIQMEKKQNPGSSSSSKGKR